MAIQRLCPICGEHYGTCNSPSRGVGLTVFRLEPKEGENKMSEDILLSAKRYYLTKDKTRAVEGDSPEADSLLVGKNCAVLPEVADRYGLETTTGKSIARVERSDKETREAMVTQGTTGNEVVYDRMKTEREVIESTKVNAANPHYSGAVKQAALMAQGVVNEKFGEVDRMNGKPLDEKAAAYQEGTLTVGNSETVGQDRLMEDSKSPEQTNTKTKVIGGGESATAAESNASETGENKDAVTGTADNEYEAKLKDALNNKDLAPEGENQSPGNDQTLKEKAAELEKDLNNKDFSNEIKPPNVQ